ncbi:hypothetical protein BG004_004023 [Podila humilis]|nr:hypothetical protein BG004_004023 [Podila humilis]
MPRTLRMITVAVAVILLLTFTFTDTNSIDFLWTKDKYSEVKFYSPTPYGARRMTERNRAKTLRNYPAEMTRLEDVVDSKHPKNLLVVVFVTASMVETRGKAVIETYADYANNKHPELGVHVVLAYDGAPSTKIIKGVPAFPVKSADYNTLYTKVYDALETVWELYGHDYEFFMKADDDLFVHIDRVATAFGSSKDPSISSSQLHFFGFRDPGDPMCWGGPGYVWSRQSLKELYPHLNQCSKDFRREEDISLSWCYRRYFLNVHNQPWAGCQSIMYEGSMSTFGQVAPKDKENWALWQQPDVEYEEPVSKINNYKYSKLLTLHSFKSETEQRPTMQEYYNFYYHK